MDFETFAKLYAAIRFRLGRADDLFEAAVIKSGVATQTLVDGSDGELYHLIATKEDGGAYISVQRAKDGGARGSRILINTRADLSAHTVRNLSTSAGRGRAPRKDTIARVLDALKVKTENGRETMAYFDDNHRADTPLEEAAEDRSIAEKAARMILAGIGKLPELDPSEMFLVVQAMVVVLADPSGMNRAGRVENALAWALHPKTQPEWAIYLARWIRTNIPVENQNSDSLGVLAERYPGL